MTTDGANSNNICYELYSDNCDGTVTIKNLLQDNYFICCARQVLENENIVKGLSDKNIAHIKAIAAMDA
jgi:hypothetical protein